MPKRSAAFNPEAANAMAEAFHAAWQSLKDCGSVDAAPYKADRAREVLAMRIIATASGGERDVTRLRDDALTHLANLKAQKQA